MASRKPRPLPRPPVRPHPYQGSDLTCTTCQLPAVNTHVHIPRERVPESVDWTEPARAAS